MTQALTDALASARAHLAEETAALALCLKHSWTRDARTAEREVAHFTALVARLEKH